MTFGTSLFLLAVGAILRYAVNDEVEAIDLEVVGLILMIVGAVGLVIGIWQWNRYSRGTTVEERPVERVERRDRY